MKYKLIIGAAALLLFAGNGMAQVQADLMPRRALTFMEKQMYANADLNGLGSLYNSLKTEYERRYFLLGLPGFFAERKIQIVAPAWVKDAILNGLQSKDPLSVHNAAVAAGMLRINCATQLIVRYKTVHNTFGSHEDMIKTAMLGALCGMEDPGKQAFLYDVLTKDHYPLLSGTFGALLSALGTVKSTTYVAKLAVYSDTLDSLSERLSANKEQEYKVRECRAVQERIMRLRNSIGGN